MWNVGFGDCFTFSEGSELMMVDCGTVNLSNKVFNPIVDGIKSSFIDKHQNNYALITHFHDDHIKGFKYLSENYSSVFNKIYIPHICQDSDTHRMVLLELAIYCYLMFPKSSASYLLSENILNHIEMVTELAKNYKIKCLSSGDIFRVSNKYFKVLWPDKEFTFDEKLKGYLKVLDENLSKYLRELREINLENIGLEELKENIINNISEWYSIFNEEDTSDNNGERIKEIISTHKAYLEELNSYRGRLDFDAIITNAFRYHGTKLFSEGNNATSIVFHNISLEEAMTEELAFPGVIISNDDVAATKELALSKEVNSPKDETSTTEEFILMMGDVTRKVMDNYLKYRLKEKYAMIKTPHHGTKSHFTDKLPKSKKLLISTGMRPGYGKISIEYSKLKAQVKCTSGYEYCEKIDVYGRCPKDSCNNSPWYNDRI